jgi:serine phosphatase RsbU (regulator of sigma subunit)
LLCQDRQEILDEYDLFLAYEFEEPNAAFTHLNKGIELAIKKKDASLIGYGYKYMSWYYEDNDDINQALSFVDSSIIYTEQTNDPQELVNAYNQKGNILSGLAQLDSSLIWYHKALDISNQNKDNEGIAKVANNMALVYTDQGEYLDAIDYFHLSIDKSKEIDDLSSIGDAYNNLGSLFTQIEDYDQAISYHMKAYDIRKESDDSQRLSSVVLNIGRIYLTQEKYDSAKIHFFQSLAIDKELDDKSGIALNYNNIGLAHYRENNLDSALYYYHASLDIRIELNDPFGMALSYNNLGDYYLENGNSTKAVEFCNKSYAISNEKNLPFEKLEACNCLYKAFESKGDLTRAYKYLKESVDIEEKLNSQENKKQLTKKEMQFVFHYQELEDSLKQAEILAEKEYQIKSAQLEKERLSDEKKNQLWLFSVIGFFLLLIGAIIYRQLRVQRKQNQLIKEKNEFIKEQKHEIDQSISYAQKIQDTALPSESLTNLFDNAFMLYLPRDVVSGDFYWFENNDNHAYFAVADCTGHGIPGAFISMIGTILLNEIYNSKKLTKPGDILDELNRLIQLTLKSRTGQQMKDGMDISFCRLDKKSLILEYAGANNPLWVISDEDKMIVNGSEIEPNLEGKYNLFEVKADKKPIGKYAGEDRSFRTNTIQLKKNDQIYLFSDGFADQFGGERGKKFKYKPFKRLLIDMNNLPAEDQKKSLHDAFNNWKGDYEQIDDICVMGAKV